MGAPVPGARKVETAGLGRFLFLGIYIISFNSWLFFILLLLTILTLSDLPSIHSVCNHCWVLTGRTAFCAKAGKHRTELVTWPVAAAWHSFAAIVRYFVYFNQIPCCWNQVSNLRHTLSCALQWWLILGRDGGSLFALKVCRYSWFVGFCPGYWFALFPSDLGFWFCFLSRVWHSWTLCLILTLLERVGRGWTSRLIFLCKFPLVLVLWDFSSWDLTEMN